MAGNNLYFVHVNAIILLTDTNKEVVQVERQKETLKPFKPHEGQMALVDFSLSNARQFYSSMGNPLGLKGLTT